MIPILRVLNLFTQSPQEILLEQMASYLMLLVLVVILNRMYLQYQRNLKKEKEMEEKQNNESKELRRSERLRLMYLKSLASGRSKFRERRRPKRSLSPSMSNG